MANGERVTTYAIRAAAGSGIISVNGAAAHKASPGVRVIICTYASFNQHELANFDPILVYLDQFNRVERVSNAIPVQVAKLFSPFSPAFSLLNASWLRLDLSCFSDAYI